MVPRWMLGKTNLTYKSIGKRRTGASSQLTIGYSPAPAIQATACRQVFCKVHIKPGLTTISRCLSSVSVTTSLQVRITRLVENYRTRIPIQAVSNLYLSSIYVTLYFHYWSNSRMKCNPRLSLIIHYVSAQWQQVRSIHQLMLQHIFSPFGLSIFQQKQENVANKVVILKPF